MPNIGRKNIELDQFYTRENAVKKCMSKIKTDKYDCVIEPSAGGGAFLERIKNPEVIAMDINPTAKGILKRNYFDYELEKNYKKVLVVGNPPFGVRHELSDKFLQKSFSLPGVKTVAFVLPNTYNKVTRQKIIPQEWRIKDIIPLEQNSFTYDGEIRHIPCSFFVFDKSKGRDKRFDTTKYQKARDFDFVTENESDWFIFGANPGKVIKKPTPNNRGYFIKSRDICKDILREKMERIKWIGFSCASGGVAWYSKLEVVWNYNNAYPS